MNQRDIYLADLDPVIGHEQGGLRPVIVVSGDMMNEHFNMCVVCPLTSKIKDYFMCPLIKANHSNKLYVDSQVVTFQIRAVAKDRLKKRIGEINNIELSEILRNLMFIFRY